MPDAWPASAVERLHQRVRDEPVAEPLVQASRGAVGVRDVQLERVIASVACPVLGRLHERNGDVDQAWAAYQQAIPQGQLYVGKEETHGIERDNARQRHWLARFRRRSIVVSKAKRMADASIALFARFGGNDRIGELTAMLA